MGKILSPQPSPDVLSHCISCGVLAQTEMPTWGQADNPQVLSLRSNIKPEKANANHHNFQMYTFEKTTNCKACRMFLR